MYLMVDEFNDSTPIETTIRIQHKGIKLGYIRAHCLKHGTATGSFTITIAQNGTDLASATITADDINNIAGTYAHGFFTWTFDNPVQLAVAPEDTEQEYELRFISSGYTGTGTDYFAVCKDFDNALVDEHGLHFNSTTPEQKATTMPYGLELYKWDI